MRMTANDTINVSTTCTRTKLHIVHTQEQFCTTSSCGLWLDLWLVESLPWEFKGLWVVHFQQITKFHFIHKRVVQTVQKFYPSRSKNPEFSTEYIQPIPENESFTKISPYSCQKCNDVITRLIVQIFKTLEPICTAGILQQRFVLKTFITSITSLFIKFITQSGATWRKSTTRCFAYENQVEPVHFIVHVFTIRLPTFRNRHTISLTFQTIRKTRNN